MQNYPKSEPRNRRPAIFGREIQLSTLRVSTVVALLAAAGTSGLTFTPSAKSVASRPAVEENTIAVMPFDSPISTFRGGQFLSGITPDQAKSFGDALAQLVTTDLVKDGSPMVDRTHLTHIMKEQKLDNTGVVSMETAVQIGKLAGAHFMIFGSVQSLEIRDDNVLVVHRTKGEIEAQANIVDVTTGRIVKSFSGKGSKEATGLAPHVFKFNGVDQARSESSSASSWLSMPLIGDAAKELAGKIADGLVEHHVKLLQVLAVDPNDGIVVDFGGTCPYSEGDKVSIQRVTKVVRNAAGAVVYQQLKVIGSGKVSNVQGTAFTVKPDKALSELISEKDQIVLKAE